LINIPKTDIQSLFSLARIPLIPNITPITAGRTNSRKLRIRSAVIDKLESEDSNRVIRKRNKTDTANNAKDFAPRLVFI
jgi:hypothetical protein